MPVHTAELDPVQVVSFSGVEPDNEECDHADKHVQAVQTGHTVVERPEQRTRQVPRSEQFRTGQGKTLFNFMRVLDRFIHQEQQPARNGDQHPHRYFPEIFPVGGLMGFNNGKTAEQQHERVQGSEKGIGVHCLFPPFRESETVQQVAGYETAENDQFAGYQNPQTQTALRNRFNGDMQIRICRNIAHLK